MTAEPATEPPRRLTSVTLRLSVFVLTIAFIGLLSFGLATQAPDTTIDDALVSGAPKAAPGFSLDVLSVGDAPAPTRDVVERVAADGVIALSELRGAPVVINFWASWCDPCRAEAGALERAWQLAAPKGAVFLGINQQDATEDASAFLAEFSVSYPNVREAGKETSRSYGLTGFPETFFVSPAGDVVGHVIGVVDEDQLRRGLVAAQTGTIVELGTGGARQDAP